MIRKEQAFTMIELMIVIAIMAVLLTIAAPSLQTMIRNNRITGQANELVVGLILGRSEAVKRGVPVTLCPSADGASCVADGQWEQGWLVFSDIAGNGVVELGTDACLASEDCLLMTHEELPGGYTLRTGGVYTNWLSYLPTGAVVGSNGTGVDAFRLCPENAEVADAKNIEIAITGRVKVKKGGVLSCP